MITAYSFAFVTLIGLLPFEIKVVFSPNNKEYSGFVYGKQPIKIDVVAAKNVESAYFTDEFIHRVDLKNGCFCDMDKISDVGFYVKRVVV